MSTLKECVDAGLLIWIGGNLRPHQQPCRLLAATPRAIEWMRMTLPTLPSDGYADGAMSPMAQAGSLFNRWVAGEPFERPLPREMRPVGEGIWELRTDDLRFFGWFPQHKAFVISAAQPASTCKDKDLYRGFLAQAVADRGRIALNGGTFMKGNIDDLV